MSVLKKIYAILLDFVEAFVLVGAMSLVIYAFLFRPYQVIGESMVPNYLNKEYILTNLISIRLSDLNRGDIIVFKAPTNSGKDYIKRIIGLPRDKILLKGSRVYINDALLNENSYLPSDAVTDGRAFLREGQEITVPSNNYFVLGDNRSMSSDSREWGFVSKDKIIGKSQVVYWPLQKFKIVKRVEYNLP